MSTERIKVAFVINEFAVGGAEKMVVELLTRLDRTAFDPLLITLFYRDGRTYLYDTLPGDVSIRKLRFKSFGDVSSWFALYQALRALDPDVVVSNLFFSNTVIRVFKPLLSYKVITVEHNTYTGKTTLQRFVDRILAVWTARIVAVSKTVADFTARQEGIPAAKFVVIPNGIDVQKIASDAASSNTVATRNEFGVSQNVKVLLNVARIVPQKNHTLLIEGFAKFVANHPDYVLLIAGAGNTDALQEQAERLGIAGRVIFAGFQKDVARLYAIVDWFVSTSSIEGFGIAHLEALACGVPVITTKTAGPDEMIEENKNGFFITDSTSEAVAHTLERTLLANHTALSTYARESAQRYSIVRTVGNYEDVMRTTVR